MTAPAAFHPQFVVAPQGARTSVLLPIAEYETLLEDLSDLVAVDDKHHARFDDLIAALAADGLRLLTT